MEKEVLIGRLMVVLSKYDNERLELLQTAANRVMHKRFDDKLDEMARALGAL